jgi:hypothetical protein
VPVLADRMAEVERSAGERPSRRIYVQQRLRALKRNRTALFASRWNRISTSPAICSALRVTASSWGCKQSYGDSRNACSGVLFSFPYPTPRRLIQGHQPEQRTMQIIKWGTTDGLYIELRDWPLCATVGRGSRQQCSLSMDDLISLLYRGKMQAIRFV